MSVLKMKLPKSIDDTYERHFFEEGLIYFLLRKSKKDCTEQEVRDVFEFLASYAHGLKDHETIGQHVSAEEDKRRTNAFREAHGVTL